MEPSYCFTIIGVQVLSFSLPSQIADVRRFETDEQTAQPAIDGLFDQVRLTHGIDCARRLPKSPHAAHAVEESGRELGVAEEVVVQEVEVPARQSLDLRKGAVH